MGAFPNTAFLIWNSTQLVRKLKKERNEKKKKQNKTKIRKNKANTYKPRAGHK